MDAELKKLLYKTVRDRRPYVKEDEKGMALGCFEPFYLAHPEENGEHRFPFPTGYMNARDYILDKLDRYCNIIDVNRDLQEGDILTINMPFGMYHVGIYLGGNDVLHCSQKAGFELIKLSLYRNRIERGYRYNASSRSSIRMG
jgi:hypothetical protein